MPVPNISKIPVHPKAIYQKTYYFVKLKKQTINFID